MQAADRTQIPGMRATLCSYEGHFGPFHPQTLSLMAQLGIAYFTAGEIDHARPLLEKVVRDAARNLGREHAVRLRAIEALRDVLLAQGHRQRATIVQREIVECQIQRFGTSHPEVAAAHACLAAMAFETAKEA